MPYKYGRKVTTPKIHQLERTVQKQQGYLNINRNHT